MYSVSNEALLENLSINESEEKHNLENIHQNSDKFEYQSLGKTKDLDTSFHLNESTKNKSLDTEQITNKILLNDDVTKTKKTKSVSCSVNNQNSKIIKVYESGDRLQSSITNVSSSDSPKKSTQSHSTPVMDSLKTRRKNAPKKSEVKIPIEINKRQVINKRKDYLEELLWDMNCLNAAKTVNGTLPFKTIHLRRLITQELTRVTAMLPTVYSSPPAVVAVPKPVASKNCRNHQSVFPHQNFYDSNLSSASPGVRRLNLFPEELISSTPILDYPISTGYVYNKIMETNSEFDVVSDAAKSFHVKPAFWIRENEPNQNYMHNRKLPGVVDYGLSNSLRLSRSLNNTINTFGHINSKRINIASGSSPSLSVSPNSLISTLGIGVRLPSRYNSSPNSGDSDGIKDKLNKAGRTRKSHTIRKNSLYSLSHKIFIPDHPTYNFIGRILGPRGNSVRRLESLTACKILIRGKGSVKDQAREDKLRNITGWEHLNGPLHLLITAEDENEALCSLKLSRAVSTMQRLLTPQFDSYKRQQLIQLAIINGTYRP